jgi:outer membrane receptor protein involved in Fe transport
LNGSIYHIDWKDVPIAYILACGNGVTLNAAGIRVNGAEFDATMQVSERLTMGLGSSYTDSTFTSALDFASIIKGERTPAVPRVTANVWSSYEVPVNDRGTMAYGFATLSYVGDLFNYAGTGDPRRIDQPGYTLGNIRAGVRSGPWDLSLYVNNVTDKRALLFLDRILGTTRPNINRPRTVGLNLKWTF